MKDNRELYVSKRLLKPFYVNDILWKQDCKFDCLEKEKEKVNEKQKSITFNTNVLAIYSNNNNKNIKLRN
jgi:hypothetical protein